MKKSLVFSILLVVLIIFVGVFILYANQNLGYFIFSTPFFNETYVSFRFDDALVSQLKAFELLEEYNYTGSVYVITSEPDATGWQAEYYLNWTQLKEVSDFMEIGSHTVNHVDLIYSKNPELEIKNSKEELSQRGFNVSSFVYPGGNYNTRILGLVEENYMCASTQDVGTNWVPLREYLLKDFTFRKSSNLATIQRVIKPGKWNILTFHDIRPMNLSGLPSFYASIAESNSVDIIYFREILNYIKKENITVIKISDGCKKFS
jgi:peptidoglycan/xylan/chitin deacetylase (PgdA/CDA1 family)